MKESTYLMTSIIMGVIGLLSSCKDDKMMPEPQNGTITIENVVTKKDYVQSGTFSGTGNPPVIFPGKSTSIKFNAGKGQYLAFATMYGASKDWFFAPENPGLKLYNEEGKPIIGDVSSHIKLWDNGTKENSKGDVESKAVSEVSSVKASTLMKLNLAYDETKSEFTLTIMNTSGGTDHETPFSPGVWAVSNVLGNTLLNKEPFFKSGARSNPEITAIAERGNNELLATKTEANTGIITGISPVVVVVYQGENNPIYQIGAKDMANGLKEVAQTGDPSKLKARLLSKQNVKEVYIAGDGPIAPGAKVSTSISTEPGDKIAYVTMFGYSNDWFYANEREIAGNEKGDLTSRTMLFDNGTAIDQYPGAGNKQAVFGGTPEPENNNIMRVGDNFPVPALSSVLKIIYQ